MVGLLTGFAEASSTGCGVGKVEEVEVEEEEEVTGVEELSMGSWVTEEEVFG